MLSNSLSGFTSISQWALFLGITLIIFGVIEKRERYIIAGQFSFIALGFLALWILFTERNNLPTENYSVLPKELKALAFFKVAAIYMAFTILSLLQKIFKLPFHKTGIYFLIFFALLLFFMLFSIMQMPHIPSLR
jgi:hypothetical protein